MIRILLSILGIWVLVSSLLIANHLSSNSNNKKNRIYTVKDGDSLSTIAHHYHIGTDILRKANNLGDKILIKPGDELKIPLEAIKKAKEKDSSKNIKENKRIKKAQIKQRKSTKKSKSIQKMIKR